jgi:predicted transcriptional regulator
MDANITRRRNARRTSRKAAAMEAVFEAKLAGRTFSAVARELGITPQYAGRLYKAEMAERAAVIGELADRERALQDARLEALLAEHWPRIASPKSAEIVLRCLDRKARLYGLDAPTRLEHSGVVDVVHEASAERRQRILAETAAMVAEMTPEQLAAEAASFLGVDVVESEAVEVDDAG